MIRFSRVTRLFGSSAVVRDLNFFVAEGETLVLLGTSGCGKSTTLRMVNRLIDPTSGGIFIENQNVMYASAPALRRKIGMSIQGSGLFPHMTVGENIAITCRLLGWCRKKIESRVNILLDMVEMESCLREKYPHELSGGQKQRVGVARSLAAYPKILLMDEPFGALDPITRESLQNQFLQILEQEKKSVLFVTHDVCEAVKMADRIAVMHDGEIQQIGSAKELIENPANDFVNSFFGSHAFQLNLMIERIESLYTPCAKQVYEKRDGLYVSPRNSILDALDMFKQSGLEVLPVVHARMQIGTIEKAAISEMIIESMGAVRV